MSSILLSSAVRRSVAASLFRSASVRSTPPSLAAAAAATAAVEARSTPLSLRPPYHSCSRCPFSSSSDGSHSDFSPQRKSVPDGEDEDEVEKKTLEMIKSHVESNKIMLYMKGNPSMPMCGFSARVVQVLKDEGADFSSVNVLDYPTIREGVKKFSDWPTIPQLYVDGEFVGGCDIVTSMHESGELKELLNVEAGKDKGE